MPFALPRPSVWAHAASLAAILAAILCAATAVAAPHAFVSVQGQSEAVQVIDLATMAIEMTIGNVGDEPNRMVANADRSMIWLASSRDLGATREGLVHRIDTRSRAVVASRAVGNRQIRSIALSPDAARVYTWKQQTNDGVTTIGVAVLDAMTLDEIAIVPITGPACVQSAGHIGVSPDGRVVATGCADGMRIINPLTHAVTLGSVTPVTASFVFGFSPDGAEVYVNSGSAVTGGGTGTGIRAIDLDTGVGTDFTWAGGGAGFPSNSAVSRMVVVQRPTDPPGDPSVFFTYASAFGNPPIAWARSSDLAPATGPRLRQLLGRTNVGPATAFDGSPDGTVGLGGRIGGIQRIVLDGVPSADGPIVPLAGMANLSDIVIVPPVVDVLFADGFD